MSVTKTSFVDILRALDDAKLEPSAMRLLLHYWRVGVCWESRRTTSQKTGMSLGSVSRWHNWLSDNGYIEPARKGDRIGFQLRIAALIQVKNECSEYEQEEPPIVVNVHNMNASVQNMNGSVQNMNAILSIPHEVNLIKTTTTTHAPHFEPPIEAVAEADADLVAFRSAGIYDDYAPRTIPAPSSPAEADSPVWELARSFETHLGYPAPYEHSTTFREKWQPTLSAILEFTGGDMERAKAIVNAACEFARGKGPGSNGKTFALVSPFSIRNIWRNRVAELDAAQGASDADTLWRNALDAITRRDYSDTRLKDAIRAIGGSMRIQTAGEKEIETLRRQLEHEYRHAITV